ncbi:anti-sigma factor [Nocardioides sp. C4-1]|uniref:anti-sigma factor n=1 Tax=Nocardioides sp. C4-1 TaxID=3151851 RepID=UPI00326465CC
MSVDIHALSGAYAVDALDEFERAQFERHLAGCSTCRDEVDSLTETATLLPETSALSAPDSLRASVLAEIQTVRPLPPVVVAAAERGRSTRRRFPALVAAAVALIAIGGAGATVWHNAQDDAPAGVYDQVAAASDAEVVAASLPDGGTIKLAHSPSSGEAVLSATDLAPLPDGRTYQMWLDQDGEMVWAGFLDDPDSGAVLHGDLSTATSANITVEDSEKAEHPDLQHFVGAVELA